jgi:hypothetical protein
MVVCVCRWLSPMWPVYVAVADVARDVARVAVALWLSLMWPVMVVCVAVVSAVMPPDLHV